MEYTRYDDVIYTRIYIYIYYIYIFILYTIYTIFLMYNHPVSVSQDVLCLQEVRMAAAGPKGENLWERKTHMAYGKGKHLQDKRLPSGNLT